MKDFFENKLILDETVSCHYIAPGTGTPVHRNRWSHGLVYYPAPSCLFSFLDGPQLQTEEGSVLYLPKGANYNVLKGGVEDVGCWCMNFLTVSPLECEPFVMELRSPEKVQNLFVAATKLYRERRTAYDSRLRSIFYEILSLMETEYNQKYLPSHRANCISPAMEYIDRNCYDKNINIDELSLLCGISSTYFRRIFAQIYGMSPVKYINSLRIKRAKELIDSQMYASIADIATLCGFSDDCYFRKVFKAETRMTPLEYKNRRG